MNVFTYPSKRPSRRSVFLFIVHAVLIAAMGIGYLYSFVTFKLESRDFIEHHHWNLEPAHDLPLLIDFKKGGNASMFTVGDWSEPEDRGTWTDGNKPILKVKLKEEHRGKPLIARIKITRQHLRFWGRIKVYANGKRVNTWTRSELSTVVYREIPAFVPKDEDTLVIELRITGAHSPKSLDRRKLGISVETILLSEAPTS